MPEAIVSQCAGIANEIEVLEAERADLQQGLAEAEPSMKALLLREIRLINVELGRLRQQLLLCQQQNPPAPRPDLFAQGVLLQRDHPTRTLGVAAVVKNIGRGDAHGPFIIALSVTLEGGGTLNYFREFEVPAGVTLVAEPVLAPPDGVARQEVGQAAQPAATTAFPGGQSPWLSSTYVTEYMVVPLRYRDESPYTTYWFEFLVDSENQVSEPYERNNAYPPLHWWALSPGSAQRTTPFVVEAKSGNVDEAIE